jgi:hypothetical protein
MSTERKVQVARELAGSLDAAGINYAFIHGLERFPAAMGRDLDLLVQHDQMDRAVLGAMRHFRGQKWHFVAHRRLNGHYWCFVAPPDRRIVCEFDLIPCLRWGPAILVDRPHPVAGIEHFKTDPWASFVKRVLLQLLSGNTAKLHKRPEELVIADVERAVVRRSLADFVGEGLSTSLIRAIELRDFDALPSLIPSLRRAVVLRSIRQHPGAALGSVLDWARNEFAASPLAKPIVPILGIVGVDGVGKSSLLHHVEREIRARLPVLDVQTRHWRPRILPSLGRLVGKERPGEDLIARPPRRSPGRGQFLRIAYYGVDYCIGAWRDRHAAARLIAVVYDRCALDMLVDPWRFGFKTSRGVGLVRRLARGPQLVVLLHDSRERIRARKSELEPEEIDRQQAAWLALAEKGEIHLVLRVEAPPDILAVRVVDQVIDRLFGVESEPCPSTAHTANMRQRIVDRSGK